MHRVRLLWFPLLVAALTAAFAAAPAPASAAGCDLVAAASGSDEAPGTADAPLASPSKLLSALAPGQTGCIRGEVTENIVIETPNVTLTSEPGQRGTLRGELIVADGASGVTVSDLDLDGSPVSWPTPAVLGDDATFSGNDVTSRGTHICFIVGQYRHGTDAAAERTRITGNRIHDCGSSNNHQHGIYVEHAVDTKIIGNEIFDNGDRAIQLFPNAQRTEVAGNVIDGNGEGVIFSSRGDAAARGSRVHHNVLSNPRLRAVVESWWEGPVGGDNVVEDNCVYRAGGGEPIDETNGGFVARDNIEADPQFVDRAAKDFRLAAGSPCAALLEAGRTGVDLPVRAAAPAAAARRTADGAPLDLAVMSAAVKGSTRTVTMKLRVRRQLSSRAYARVELRYSGRGWKVVGTPRLARGRTSTVKVRVPKGARNLKVRATLLKAGRKQVVTFRARR